MNQKINSIITNLDQAIAKSEQLDNENHSASRATLSEMERDRREDISAHLEDLNLHLHAAKREASFIKKELGL